MKNFLLILLILIVVILYQKPQIVEQNPVYQKIIQKINDKTINFNDLADSIKFKFPANGMTKEYLTYWLSELYRISDSLNIPFETSLSFAAHESRFNEMALGSSEDAGLYQVTPVACKSVGIDYEQAKSDPLINAKAALLFLSKQKNSLGAENQTKWISAYNSPSLSNSRPINYVTGVQKYQIYFKQLLNN